MTYYKQKQHEKALLIVTLLLTLLGTMGAFSLILGLYANNPLAQYVSACLTLTLPLSFIFAIMLQNN